MDNRENRVDIDAVYLHSEDIVAREIEGEVVIIPLVSGVGDIDDEFYALNETGRAVWEGLDGRKSLRVLAGELATRYEAPAGEIEADVAGLAAELLRRKMITRRAE